MKYFQRLLVVFVLLMVSVSPVYAQITILPQASSKVDCSSLLQIYELKGEIPDKKTVAAESSSKAINSYDQVVANSGLGDDPEGWCAKNPLGPECQKIKKAKDEKDVAYMSLMEATANNGDSRSDLLGCAIKTGRVSLQMIPYFITYFSNFLLSLVGIICVLFIVIGGYQYIRGGLTENKEKGKKTIEHALFGMVIAILAWVIVNLVMGALTS